MGGGHVSSPIVVSKFCRVLPRRLISGFLSVNVVNAQAGTEKDDFNEWSFTNPAPTDILTTNPFFGPSPVLTDPGRTGKKLSFGDYDCFLFWVVGGMVLETPTFGSAYSSAVLTNNGYSDTTADTWHPLTAHNCQSFLKYHLVSRINNGYGHVADGNTNYAGTVALERRSYRSSSTTINDTDTTATPGVDSCARDAGKYQHFIMSDGLWSAESHGGEVLSTDSKNTFFPPVENIEIYGIHYYNFVSQSGDLAVVYNTGHASHAHSTAFYDIVVKVSYRGFEDGNETTLGVATDADKQFFKTNTNIFFQPFGETANMSWDDSAHTS